MAPESESTVGFDFDGHRQAAVDAYQRVRADYERFADTVRSILIEALARAGIRVASIEARAKSLDSYREKAATPADGDDNRPKYANH